MPNRIELIIEGRNLSVQALDQANRDVQRFVSDVDRSMGTALRASRGFQQELAQGSRVVRVVAGDLATTLNPALGETVSGLATATAATRGMSLATGGLVAGLVVAGTGLSQYIRNLNDATERQAALNLAVRGFDAGALRQQMTQAALAIEQSQVRQGSFIGRVIEGLKEIAANLGLTTRATEELARARAGLEKVLPIEREVQLAEAYQKQQAALGPLLQVGLQRAVLEADLEQFLDIHFRMAQALAAEAASAREVALSQGKIAEAQAVARGASEAELDTIREQIRAQVDLINTQAVTRTKALEFQRDQGALDIRGRQLPPPANLPFERAEGELTPEDLARGRAAVLAADERALALRIELLQVEQQRVDVLGTIEGLSLRDRDALDLSVASARERLRLREAEAEIEKAALSGDPRRIEIANTRRNLVELEEAIRRSNLAAAQTERTSFTAGLAKGFRDLNDDLESFGRDGERIVRQFASSAHGFFSDLLFAPLEDDWKKALQDTPRRLLQGIGREITDALARFTVGGLLRGAQSLFPGITGAITGAGVISAPAAAPAATAQALQALQALQAAGSLGGGGQIQAGSALANLPIGTLLSVLQTGTPSISAASLEALALGGPSGFSGAAGFGGPTAATLPQVGLGSLIGPALGAVGGALGLGFTIFGALQGPPTAQNIGFSALGGAVSGAALAAGLSQLAAAGIFGASIAGAAPSFGVSLIIGAIAGAALGAGAGALGKGDTGLGPKRAGERAQTASAIYNELADAINSGNTFEQIAFTKIHTGNTVGGLLLNIAANNAAGRYAGSPWNWAPSARSQALANQLYPLGVQSEEFSEGRVNSIGELIAAFGGTGDVPLGVQRAEDLIRSFLDVATQEQEALTQAAQNTPFSFLQQADVGGVGTVGVRTFLPVSRAEEARGQNILVNPDFFRNLPPAVAAALWARLLEVDFDMNLGIVDRHTFSGELP